MADLRLITQKEPWPELVAKLKELTAEAERGELCAFAHVMECTDGALPYGAFHNTGSNAFKMVGQLECLKLSVIRRHCAEEED